MRLRELHVRYLPRSDLPSFDCRKSIDAPSTAARLLTEILQDESCEVFGILCLTTKHKPVCWHEVSRGTLDGTFVHPREVFKAAFLANAAGVILAHNHPSGDPDPSPDDRELTRRLTAAGHLLGLEVIDHIVVGDGYRSFKELGLL